MTFPSGRSGSTRASNRVSDDRQRVWLGTGLTVVLALVVVAFACSGHHPQAGPLAAVGVARSVSDPGPEARVGRPFTFLGAEFDSRDGAVLDDAELVGASPGLRIVGRYVVLPAESVPVLIGFFFPPARVKLHPLVGWQVLGPTAVTLALQVDAPGHYEATAVRLAYHIGSARYEALWPIGVKVTVGDR
jgi:hypothetical protein